MATAFPCTLLPSDKTEEKKIRLKLKINFQKTYVPKTIGKNSEFRNKLAILLMKCIKSVNQNKKVTNKKKLFN